MKNKFSILYVGNSFTFTGDVPKQVSILSKMYGLSIDYETICYAGTKLCWVKNEATEKMKNNDYDYVIFQDHGSRPVFERKDFLSDVEILCKKARESRAIPALYNPAWANINGRPNKKYQVLLTLSYETAARINNTILINAAEAWIYAYEKHPDISLYQKGDFHANDAGAYLTACVFVSTLFNLCIKDIAENNIYHGDDVIRLAQAAWEYVSYYNENKKSLKRQ